MNRLGYFEKGILVRAEYDPAFDELRPAEKNGICRGVVLTGQPMELVLYTLLTALLIQGKPVLSIIFPVTCCFVY